MFKIEDVCENISSNIAKELNLDNDKRSIINYGMFAIIQMVICIVLVIIFGFIFNVAIEALIISFTISILRKSSGGAHAQSPESCAIIGTFVSVALGVISKHINASFSFVILIASIIFVWSYYIICKLAPVDSIAKPIKSIEKRTRLKKSSIMILSVYLITTISGILYFYFIRNSSALIYSLCICMGLLWQVFSLTKYGHLVIEKLDKLFK